MVRSPRYEQYVGPKAAAVLRSLDDGWVLLGALLVALGLGLLVRSAWSGAWDLRTALVGGGLVLAGAFDVLYRRRRLAKGSR